MTVSPLSMFSQAETIVAVASAPGRGGVAVLRLSGPRAGPVVEGLTKKALPAPRFAQRTRFYDPLSGALLDEGLLLWFPGPASFTGENVAEIQCHGGRAVTESLLTALCTGGLVRPAEAGEFSRRAFENGKMDLTQAEAIADLVNADTAAQHRQAVQQMDGALARLYEGWRHGLVRSLAHLEAYIDFPEEDLSRDVDQSVRTSIIDLERDIRSHLADGHRGERIRDGVTVAVIGAPNAGKSSLVNAWARRDVAIVSARAGTTRDVVEVHLDVAGYPVILADTAGLRDAGEDIEVEGMRRARDRAGRADLKVAVFDGTTWPAVEGHTLDLVDESTLVVINKRDCFAQSVPWGSHPPRVRGHEAVVVSVKSGYGMADLLTALESKVRDCLDCLAATAPALTRTRHRNALTDCLTCLERSRQAPALDLMAEDLRLATRALGRITGRVDVEDILDVIFRDFCIGK